jgi:predicted RNase H-like HicB family nuclease
LIVASARPLEVVSAGKTEIEARKNLDEALLLFLETTREMGTLDVILEESGYRLVDGVWEPPAVTTSRETVEVSV